MIRTHHVIETQDTDTIIRILSRAINTNLAGSIRIESGESGLLSFVRIDWDLPDYPFHIKSAVADYIYYSIAESNAQYIVDLHNDSAIIDMFQEWHIRALENKIQSLQNLKTICLGN